MVIGDSLSSRFPEGEMRPKDGYKYYLPGDISKSKKLAFNDGKLMKQLRRADRSLGSFVGQIENIPDVDQFIKFSLKKEATHSTRIEGTQVNINDALVEEELTPKEKNKRPALELEQCIEALKKGRDMLKVENLPLGERVIRDCHRTLMQQTRSHNKASGEYRKTQNRIGGSTYAEAVFVPPSPEYVDMAMRNLEAFIQDADTDMPELIKIALIHWQFEVIHPFWDGNGRMGRILIPLYLIEKRIMSEPILHMSAFFERNRQGYLRLLNNARRGQEQLIKWLHFFLKGVAEEAQSGGEKVQALVDLKRKIMQEDLPKVRGQIKKNQEFTEFLFHQPYVDSRMLREKLGLYPAVAYILLKDFTKVGILSEFTDRRRKRWFRFRDYLQILGANDEV